MDAIVHALLIWISANSDYVVDDVSIPDVVLMSPAEITAEYYSDNPELLPSGGIDDRIWALYDAETNSNGLVYLRIDKHELPDNSEQSADMIQSKVEKNALVPVALLRKPKMQDSRSRLFEDNPVLIERLLHELVHHVQFQT